MKEGNNCAKTNAATSMAKGKKLKLTKIARVYLLFFRSGSADRRSKPEAEKKSKDIPEET